MDWAVDKDKYETALKKGDEKKKRGGGVDDDEDGIGSSDLGSDVEGDGEVGGCMAGEGGAHE